MSAEIAKLPKASAAERVAALMLEAQSATRAAWEDLLVRLNAAEAECLTFSDLETVPVPVRQEAAALAEALHTKAANMQSLMERKSRR